MSRKPKTKWTPNPECEAALARILRGANEAAAALVGEKPVEDINDASGPVLILAMAMGYFLHRIDPKDAQALYFGEGSFADIGYKPLPPGYWHKKGAFSDFFKH